MRHRPRCWSREVTGRARDAASPPLLVTRSDGEAPRCGIAPLLTGPETPHRGQHCLVVTDSLGSAHRSVIFDGYGGHPAPAQRC
jgi:hypothetical protein